MLFSSQLKFCSLWAKPIPQRTVKQSSVAASQIGGTLTKPSCVPLARVRVILKSAQIFSIVLFLSYHFYSYFFTITSHLWVLESSLFSVLQSPYFSKFSSSKNNWPNLKFLVLKADCIFSICKRYVSHYVSFSSYVLCFIFHAFSIRNLLVLAPGQIFYTPHSKPRTLMLGRRWSSCLFWQLESLAHHDGCYLRASIWPHLLAPPHTVLIAQINISIANSLSVVCQDKLVISSVFYRTLQFFVLIFSK